MSCFFIASITTPLGPLVAIADDDNLHTLVFERQKNLPLIIERFKKRISSSFPKIISGMTQPLRSIQEEVGAYFAGELQTFKTPVLLHGSSFAKLVLGHMRMINAGCAQSYSRVAAEIGKPSAFRAVASVCAANELVLIIPCHRVVGKYGLGGYSAGIERKRWLLMYERRFV